MASNSVAETIKEQNDYCGITRWHDAGYTGKGITVWNTEALGSGHADTVTRRIKDAAPDAKVLQAGLEMMTSGNSVVYANVDFNGNKIPVEQFIKENNVRIVTRSVGGGTATETAASKFWRELKKKYNLIMFNSAGNDGSDGCGGALPADEAMFIGACVINGKGKVVKASYSSIGEELDFMGFTGVWSGTSFASPYLAGMTALLLQRNPKMSHDDVYDYFRTYAKDLDKTGRDDNTGYGLAMMGEVEEMKTEIKLTIGSKKYTVNGEEATMDTAPILNSDNRTLVPVRFIAEALGCEVEWNQKTKTVTITK